MTVAAGTTAKNVVVGQQVSALSVPVVIASDQTITVGGITGAITPVTPQATRADTLPVWNFGSLWNGTNWTFGLGTTGGVQFSTMGVPVAAASAQNATTSIQSAVRFFVKASPGCILRVTLNNADPTVGMYFGLVDMTTAPVGGEAFIWSWWVPANATVNIDMPRHIFMATGIAGAWSTTPNVATLAGAITGNACFLYV